MNMIDVKDRVAIITGGAGGIGLAAVRRMVRYGAVVIVFDLNEQAMQRVSDELPGVICRKVDLLDETATSSAYAEIFKKHGRIDILVNCIGIQGNAAPVENHPLDEWRRMLDVNLTGPFIACKHVIAHMRKNNYGRIINMSSTAGKDGNAMVAGYSAAKAAIMSLTKSLGKELADTGIRVNCISPAAVESPLFDRMPPDQQKIAISRIPMGRLGKVDEVAALICWLASEDCSFSTGAVFDASGGRSTY